MREDDARADEWDEEDTTVEIDDRAGTVPRCAECFAEVRVVGPIPPSSAEGARHASPETCLRGTRWSWCASAGRLSLWAED